MHTLRETGETKVAYNKITSEKLYNKTLKISVVSSKVAEFFSLIRTLQ